MTKFFADGVRSFTNWMYSYSSSKTPREQLLEYKNLVYTCVNAIAQEVAKYTPIIKRNGNPVPHQFLNILQNPNPVMSQFDFFEAHEAFMLLSGQAFWYIAFGETSGKPRELYLIRPDRVKIVIDDNGIVTGYTVRRDDGVEIPLEEREVIHIKKFNPNNPYYGLGVIEAGSLYIDVENDISEFQHNFMQNSATPSGVLSITGKTMKQEAFDKLKKQWKETYTGTKNAGKTLVIKDAEIKFEKIGLSITDLQLESLKRLSKDDVMQMFRVPRQLLGNTDNIGGGLGRNNINAVEYVFIKRTIEPELIKLDDTIRRVIAKYYGDKDLTIEHMTQVPDDEEAIINELNLGLDRWITRDEARAIRGYDEFPGGNQLYIDSVKVPIGTTNEPSTKHLHTKVVMKKKSADTSLLHAKLDKIEITEATKYRRDFKAFLQEQERRILDKVNSHAGKKAGNILYTKTFEDLTTETSVGLTALIEQLVEFVLAGFSRSGTETLAAFGLPDTSFVVGQATRDAIFNSTERLMKSFSQETALKIQKQMAAGIANNETVDELAKRIESIYDDAKGYRAARIAQKEMHTATNEGNAQGYLESGYRKMRWVSIPPSCEFCEALNGTVVDIGVPFVAKGDKVTSNDGKEFLNDYVDVQYADLHPFCDCRLEPES